MAATQVATTFDASIVATKASVETIREEQESRHKVWLKRVAVDSNDSWRPMKRHRKSACLSLEGRPIISAGARAITLYLWRVCVCTS